MSHNNRSHGKQKIVAYSRARRDRNFKQNFNKMKEAQMEKKFAGATVCPNCGYIRNTKGYILGQTVSMYITTEQDGATVKVCQDCARWLARKEASNAR